MPRIAAFDDDSDGDEGPVITPSPISRALVIQQHDDVEDEQYDYEEDLGDIQDTENDEENFNNEDDVEHEQDQEYLDDYYHQMQSKRSPTVYIPGGIDPAVLKRSQQNFRRTSYARDTTPPAVSDSPRPFLSPGLSPRGPNIDFGSSLSVDMRIFEPKHRTLSADRAYQQHLKGADVFHSVEDSPCLRILQEVQNESGALRSYTRKGPAIKPVDYALFMGRSFRIGWSRTGKIVHAGQVCTKGDLADEKYRKSFRIVVEDAFKNVHYQNIKSQVVLMHLKACLEKLKESSVILDNSQFRIERWSMPCWRAPHVYDQFIESPFVYDIGFIKMMKNLLQVFSAVKSTQDYSWSVARCVDLIDSAYGQESKWISRLQEGKAEAFMNHCEHFEPFLKQNPMWLKRRESISQWLKRTVQSEEKMREIEWSRKLKDDYEFIFSLLSVNEVAKATDIAEDTGNFRLSCMISQIGGDNEVKFLLRSQLEKWFDDGFSNHIPLNVINLYRLLCGDEEILFPKLPRTAWNRPPPENSISQSLDWTQALGVLFWYCLECDERLSESLSIFQNSLENGYGAPKPVVKYYDGIPEADGITKPEDSIYHLLLALFCEGDIINSLRPGGYSADPLDYQGPYIVLCLLECIDIGVNSMNNVACIIRQHCISSLLAEGEWACAVFVAMQIEDPQVRLVAVKPILLEWAGKAFAESLDSGISDSNIEFVKSLLVDERLLYEAAALWCETDYYRRDSSVKKTLTEYYWTLAEYYRKAECWKELSAFLCQRLIAKGYYDSKDRLMSLLAELNIHLHTDRDWVNGAGVMFEYLTLENAQQVEDDPHNLSIDLRNLLERCSRVQFWPPNCDSCDITQGHILKHDMCTYIVKLMDKYLYDHRWPTEMLDFLADMPLFPKEKLAIVRRTFFP